MNDRRPHEKGSSVEMGFNVFNAIGTGLQTGLMTGNPWAGAAAGLVGGFSSQSPATGAGQLGNGAIGGAEAAFLTQTQIDQMREMQFQLQLQEQSQQFDDMTSEKSELMRQSNVLRNVAMEQRKADNEITKEFIRSIV